ncbi:MAG: HAD family hydrolase [Candidatus Paceibacterota bacterium]
MVPTLIAFDFDKTLAYFAGTERVEDLLVNLGFGDLEALNIYQQVKATGFSFGKIIDCVKERMLRRNCPFDQSDQLDFAEDLDFWLSTHLRLYEDAEDLLSWLDRWSTPWAIVTFGDKDYQKQKIQQLHLKPMEICHTASIGAKTEPLLELVAKYGRPIFFVDDNPEELQPVTGNRSGNIVPFLIDRCDRQNPPKQFCVLSSLSEIKDFC